jgi:hypothetical protein
MISEILMMPSFTFISDIMVLVTTMVTRATAV